jgi:NhaA family Na+:H+ antiporter
MRLTKLFREFFESKKSSALILLICTVVSLLLANSPAKSAYLSFWNLPIFDHHLSHWVNDGLMAVFFLLVGLELEREVYVGELSSPRQALLPMVAALGGMVVPAALHFAFNRGTGTQGGAGIPMATDIAFALAALSLVGNRVPVSLKIFLTALAVIDDLGAILVIALFYTDSLSWINLLLALSVFGLLLVLNRLKIRSVIPYIVGGIIMWYCMLHSGIHATLAGVLLAFVIPFGNGDEQSTSYKLQHFLHKPVAFFVLPIFALANTAVTLPGDWIHGLTTLNSLGIFAGLFVGKPLGIASFSYLSSRMKITRLPEDLSMKHIIGAGFLGGIGFTMSIFITLLAFDAADSINESKIVILFSSVLAGMMGVLFLKKVFHAVTKHSAKR